MATNDYKSEPAKIISFTDGGKAEVVYESTSIRAVVELRRILVRDGKILVREGEE